MGKLDFVALAQQLAAQSARPVPAQSFEVDPGLRQAIRRYRQGVMVPKLKEWARTWQWEGGGTALLGETGAGKTSAMVLLARRLLNRARQEDTAEARRLAESIRFVTSYQIANASQRQTADNGLLERCRLARLLFLDDLGWEQPFGSKLPEIIHDRYQSGYVTVITSGMTLEQLNDHYGAALIRRIVDGGGLILEAFGNPSGKAE